MPVPSTTKPIDYLVIGHITEDLADDGSSRLGGTVSYAGLTAARLGHQVGLLTSCEPGLDLSVYADIQCHNLPSPQTTSFRNISSPDGRIQYMYHRATQLDASSVPTAWQHVPIVHLGPIAAEIDPAIYTAFPESFLCITPQGWLRAFADDGRVHPIRWPYDDGLLRAAHATVLSIEDLHNDENQVEALASISRLLVVTENHLGARVYWRGDVRRFPAPQVPLLEDTGAGDIFAACFFHRLYHTRDPWEAARFAVQLAAASVTRSHFESIPKQEELLLAESQVI